MVRATQGTTNRYVPGQVPENKDELIRFLRQELQAIQFAMSAIADGQLDDTTVAPTKPRAGMIRYTSGTWNPGAGAGFFGYHSGAWNKLG